MLDPIVRTIIVPCRQQMAFEIFIGDMGKWWPLGKYTQSAMNGGSAKTIQVDQRVGGEIFEIGEQSQQILWGYIREYNPYCYLSMDFHIPLPTENVKERSLVEVEFVEIQENQTKVTLTQSNWEAFGKRGPILQGGYGGGWKLIFDECFHSACVAVSNFEGNKEQKEQE